MYAESQHAAATEHSIGKTRRHLKVNPRGMQVGGIGGPVGQLLDQNQRILLQFKDNMRLYKVCGHSWPGSLLMLTEFRWRLPTLAPARSATGNHRKTFCLL